MGQLFHSLLDGIGWVLARIYDLVPNYGLAIILLTLMIRVLLLPLAVKQIRSMQAMQVIQPKVKEIQRKYKGKDAQSRQKMNQEVMKLYQEHGASPLSGCLPLLAQFPVLIALFAVLNFPKGLTHIPHSNPTPMVQAPPDSRLYVDIIHQQTKFLGVNLLCSPREAGTPVDTKALRSTVPDLKQLTPTSLDCGTGGVVRIPYYLLLVLMIGTTFYQQRQMQRASPAGSQQQQQQMLARIMPLFFGFIGLGFPTGLILYWTTTNGVQIIQQHFMLTRRAGVAPAPVSPKDTEGDGDGRKPGLWTRMLEARGAQESKRATGPTKPRPRPAGSGGAAPGAGGARKPGSGTSRGRPQGSRGSTRSGGTAGTAKGSQPGGGGAGGNPGSGKGSQPGGGRDGGDRKKRRKR